MGREAVELARIVGADEFVERQPKRRRAIGAARMGLLRRYLITATRTLTLDNQSGV